MNLTPLIDIARRGLPFTSTDGQTFVRLPLPSGGYFILPVRSHQFRDWFFANYCAYHDSPPSSRAFSAILNYIEAQASADEYNQRLNVFRRVGSRGSGIVPRQILLDLANPDGQFVEISPSGWQVTAGENALLQTSRSSLPLATPLASPQDPAAPLEVLRSCLNLPDRADWLRCLAWLLSALRPTGPFPFLVLQGPPTSGKTFAARVLRSLIDPSTAVLTPVPHNTGHLFNLARHNWVLAFDHISKLSPQLCDGLCRLTTGAGVTVRETPSSDVTREPLQQYIKRPMLFTVTDRWSPPSDFASRALTITLPEIPPDQRRSEADLFAVIGESYPQILGALCTAVSVALSRIATIKLTESPRYADALAWAMAAAPALGCTEEEMLDAILHPPASPFVQTIQSFLAGQPGWTGPAAELLDLLPPSPLYRDNPAVLSHHLRNNAESLAAVGITMKFPRKHRGARMIELRQKPGDALSNDPPPNANATSQPTDNKDLIAA